VRNDAVERSDAFSQKRYRSDLTTTSVTVTASRAVTEYPWTLSPTSRVIRPAERFEYLIVHLSGVLGWKFPGVY
jgi:hypothetical protein